MSEDPSMLLKLNMKCDVSHVRQDAAKISKQGVDLLMQLIQSLPIRRPTAKQALNHPWFSED
jgi:serine/threonine protein kinase